MTQLSDLYQAVILDHNSKPRNYGKLAAATHQAHGHNPLCGDMLTVYLQMNDNVIDDVKFEGNGCAISKASASLMTSSVKGKTKEQAEALFEAFHQLVTGKSDDGDKLGKLAVFAGVRQFPVRVKCASLSWHTLKGALRGEQDVSTE